MNYKKYVRVQAVFEEDGTLRPEKFWYDGKEVGIDQIFREQMAVSRKAGGCGYCYTIRCGRQTIHLFYEKDETDAWFLELSEKAAKEG